MSIMGAIVGDVVGSVYEGRAHKTTEFPWLSPGSRFTDDTVMTVATARALLTGEPYAAAYRELGRRYPSAGYGPAFYDWLMTNDAPPYGSFGNGSAMRASPVGWACDNAGDVLAEAERSARVSHDHPDGITGAQAVALAVYLARTGTPKQDIRTEISDRFGYDLSRSVAAVRPGYVFDVTCPGSVPEALLAFFDASNVEEAIRLAISLGGDADTQACIAGSVAGAFWGLTGSDLTRQVWPLLPDDLRAVIASFDRRFGLTADR
ncbi:MAG TPA: ADP-ribosylglycohydrolase family protein [Vicinamibacterales bacterium]|nr:ADP-ribosylglycohydrolase family protein [Vicinamibacterales bacterium]